MLKLHQVLCAKVRSLRRGCAARSEAQKTYWAFRQYQDITICTSGAGHYRYKCRNANEGHCQKYPCFRVHNPQGGVWGHSVEVIRDEKSTTIASRKRLLINSNIMKKLAKDFSDKKYFNHDQNKWTRKTRRCLCAD